LHTGVRSPRSLIGIHEDVNADSNDDFAELAGEACEMRHINNHVVQSVLQGTEENEICIQDDKASLASQGTLGTTFTEEVFVKFTWRGRKKLEKLK